MNRSGSIFHIAFVVLAILHLGSLISGHPMIISITKALLMPALASLFYAKVKDVLDTPRKLVLGAIFFSWIGDVALMFVKNNEIFFLLGLASFLAAHVFYIYAFVKEVRNAGTPYLNPNLPIMALPVIVTAFGLILLVVPRIIKTEGAFLAVAVTIYALTITLMVLAAANRKPKVSTFSFWMVVEGATAFMISDAMIAINKFYHPFDYAQLAIMATYIAAQYMIAWGMIRRDT